MPASNALFSAPGTCKPAPRAVSSIFSCCPDSIIAWMYSAACCWKSAARNSNSSSLIDADYFLEHGSLPCLPIEQHHEPLHARHELHGLGAARVATLHTH